MVGGRVNLAVMLQNQTVPCSSQPLDALFLSASSPSFLGSRSMVSFEDVRAGKRSDNSFFCQFDADENGDEDLDEYFHQPEKKRRLTADQVQFLEKNFEVENKLEPERKVKLAKDLGLQPRQVAIWFQNRRARWKTKQLEKDYGALQASYNSLKAEYEKLVKEKDELKTEVILLSDKLILKENERGNLELSNADNLSQAPPQVVVADSVSEVEQVSKVSLMVCKQEDHSSTKSDVFDSDSPHYGDGGHSALPVPTDSSYVFEAEQSEASQDEEYNFPSSIFPKLEDVDYRDPPTNPCNFGFTVEDHTFWSWSF